VLGATATAVERDLAGSPLAQLLARTALVGGGDARLRTADGTYEGFLYAGLTSVFGTPEAIATVEQSSAHYFQRPDAGYLHVDTDAHHLIGWHAGAIGTKRAGEWQGSAEANVESPGFELNDLGVLQSADDIDLSADIRHTVTRPGEHVFMWDAGAGASASWNFGGLRKPLDLRASGDITSRAFNAASIALDVTTPGGSDDLTRGGPVMRTGWGESATLTATTPRGRAQQGLVASASLASRLTPALRLDVTPSLTWIESDRQYVTTVTDANGWAYSVTTRSGDSDQVARISSAASLRWSSPNR
jgi:hypothetical protein